MSTNVKPPSVLTHLKTKLVPDYESKLLRSKFVIMALIMTLAGSLLIAFREVLPHAEYWRDFGIAILTAGALGLVVELNTRKEFETLIGDRVNEAIETCQKLQDIERLLCLGNELTAIGLRKLHTSRFSIDFNEFLKAADPGSEIKLLGISMTTFGHEQMRELLRKKLAQGCTIKLLILDSESQFVALRALEEHRDPAQFRKVIEAADTMHRFFIGSKNIELGHYDSAPAYFMVSTNRAMIIGFYLREGTGGHFPHLELEAKEGGAYMQFVKHFDSLWNARKEVPVVQGEQHPTTRNST